MPFCGCRQFVRCEDCPNPTAPHWCRSCYAKMDENDAALVRMPHEGYEP